MTRIRFSIFLLLFFSISTYCGISISPTILIMNDKQKMAPIYVRNVGTNEIEVKVEIVFGYIESDDTGRIFVKVDSLSEDEASAAKFLKAYPQRFFLGAGESQTIRIVAYPPPNIRDGEYWARINITGNPKLPTKLAKGSGMGLYIASAVGAPIYYRHGRVFTNIRIDEILTNTTEKEVVVDLMFSQEGNAAFIGSKTIRFYDENRKLIHTSASNLTVYKNLRCRERFKKEIFPRGKYTIEVEVVSGKRTDVKSDKLIKTSPVRHSTTMYIM